ncbi:hypothetical protein [Candidatus Nanohalococcus occultus]|uniref:Uncharacterized protein n=1 Tax=Candidatus Nanohalococcus occultus TaxID=2978047 RepID=A0ABY8CFH4_9ARCH|nr:hypothetical protein SVXNc_0949 [Candidatus Nanohaloarchaeota archaeon SVXNc]
MGLGDRLRGIISKEEEVEKQEAGLEHEMENSEDHTKAAAQKMTDALGSMKKNNPSSDKEGFANMAMALAHLHISELELKDETEKASGVGKEVRQILNEEESIEQAAERIAQKHGWNPENLEKAAEDLRNNRSVPSPSHEQLEQLNRKYNS